MRSVLSNPASTLPLLCPYCLLLIGDQLVNGSNDRNWGHRCADHFCNDSKVASLRRFCFNSSFCLTKCRRQGTLGSLFLFLSWYRIEITHVSNRLDISWYFFLFDSIFAGRTDMTCFLPPKRATPVLVPATVHYSRNFHAPIFKRVTVVNTVSVVFLPPPLKITCKPWEWHKEAKKFLISNVFYITRRISLWKLLNFVTNNNIYDPSSLKIIKPVKSSLKSSFL